MLLASIFSDAHFFFILLWVAVFILAIIIELATEQLVSIWFAGGAVIGLILAICSVHWLVQVIVVIVVSAVLVILSHYLLNKKKSDVHLKTNMELLIDQKIKVLKSVNPDSYGEGKFRDVVWSLKSDDEIKEGEFAKIIGVEGNKLIVVKLLEE